MSSVDNVDEEMVGYSMLPNFILGIVRIGLACFGIVTNMISVRVLAHRSMWSATSILLISLVVYDALFLFTGAVVILAGLPDTETDNLFLIVVVFYPFRYCAQMGSVYSTVAVTVERFIVVVKPLRARAIWTIRNARRVAIGVFLFSFIFNIPRFLIFGRFASNSWIENGTLSQNPTRNIYAHIYEVYLTMLLFYIIPYTVILILNIRLLIQLRISAKETKKISSRVDPRSRVSPTDKEDGLTVIVLGITACFFVCCVVPLSYHILLFAKPEMFANPNQIYFFAVGDTMLSINSASDFIFYCLLGRKFRRILLTLFCPSRRDERMNPPRKQFLLQKNNESEL